MDIYCITHRRMDFIEELKLIPVAVGKTECPNHYIDEKKGMNISNKNRNYGELTFHYWFWKNQLSSFESDQWIGFCQKRRFWLRSKKKRTKSRKKTKLKSRKKYKKIKMIIVFGRDIVKDRII